MEYEQLRLGARVSHKGRPCVVVALSDGKGSARHDRIVLRWEADSGAIEQVSFPPSEARNVEALEVGA